MTARGRKTRLKRHILEPAEAASLIAQLMPLVRDETPVFVVGWRDQCGRIRRVRADYPTGWRVRLHFDAAGSSTSRSASLNLTTAAVPA